MRVPQKRVMTNFGQLSFRTCREDDFWEVEMESRVREGKAITAARSARAYH
jgi:hypothetical protein